VGLYLRQSKKTVKQQYLIHTSWQYGELGPLAAEIGLPVWGTPANINGYIYIYIYIYTFWGILSPDGILARCKIHFTSESCVVIYWQRYCTALLQRVLAKLCGVVQGMELRNFRSRRHLYSAARPSRWALARISSCGMIHPAFTPPQPQSITAHWPVFISRPAGGRRLSWPAMARWNTEMAYPPEEGQPTQFFVATVVGNRTRDRHRPICHSLTIWIRCTPWAIKRANLFFSVALSKIIGF